MTALGFLKKHKDDVIRVVAGLCMCALVAALIYAFHNGKLPHSADGDAFDSVYAIEKSQQ